MTASIESIDETNLSIQNDASLLVNPNILLHKLAILLREETVCEANEPIRRRHFCANETRTGRASELLFYLNTMGLLSHVRVPGPSLPGGTYRPYLIPFFPSRWLRCGGPEMDCVRDNQDTDLAQLWSVAALVLFFKRKPPPSSAHRPTDPRT